VRRRGEPRDPGAPHAAAALASPRPLTVPSLKVPRLPPQQHMADAKRESRRQRQWWPQQRRSRARALLQLLQAWQFAEVPHGPAAAARVSGASSARSRSFFAVLEATSREAIAAAVHIRLPGVRSPLVVQPALIAVATEEAGAKSSRIGANRIKRKRSLHQIMGE